MFFTQMIAEIAKVFSQFFSYEQTSVEHQSETHTIKNSKNAKKAIDYAEKIIFLCDDEIRKFSDQKTQKKYEKYRKCFFKYN